MSLSKNKIKYIQSLKQKKYREEHNTFVAEGSKLIADLIPHLPCQLLVVTERLRNDIPTDKAEETIIASHAAMRKASHLSTPPDALAIFYQPKHNLAAVDFTQKLSLVLDEVQDPGNLGTIIRIADWFGIENIICSHNTVDLYNTKTVQATMGALVGVNVHYTDIIDFLTIYTQLPIYGTFLEGKNIYTKALQPNGFIVMGNEGRGISSEIENVITDRLYIPNFSTKNSTTESLNVAVATAVVCSEFRRR